MCKQLESLYPNVVIGLISLSVMAISWLSGCLFCPSYVFYWVLAPVVTRLDFLSTKLLPYI